MRMRSICVDRHIVPHRRAYAAFVKWLKYRDPICNFEFGERIMAVRMSILTCITVCAIWRIASADIVVTSARSETSTNATGGMPDEDSTTELGHTEGGAFSEGMSVAGSVRAYTAYFANLPNPSGPMLNGHQEVGTLTEATGNAAHSALADALTEVLFEVTADRMYLLSAGVHWEGSHSLLTGSASVRLSDETNSTLLALVNAELSEPGPGFDTDSLDSFVFLRADVMYKLVTHTGVAEGGDIAGTFAANAFSTYQLQPAQGDYNGDGIIAAADYETWKATFGSVDKLNADGNRNGTVDAADYVLWRKASGQAGTSQFVSALAIVPEPLSLLLATIGLIDLSRHRRRALGTKHRRLTLVLPCRR
jgi:hypothetical protein